MFGGWEEGPRAFGGATQQQRPDIDAVWLTIRRSARRIGGSGGTEGSAPIGRGDPFMVTVSAEETPTRLQSVGSDQARSAAASEGVEGKQARHATETHTSRRRA